jgi:cell division protein FtsB
MSETEDRLYGLMEIAERQQAAVQAVLDGLAAERAALGREREALARGVRDLQLGTQGAVRSAVTDSLAGAATEGVAAVQAATKPLLGRLAGVTAEAGQAEAALRQVVLWASWRLLGWVMAGVAGLVLLGWLASTLVLWWDTGTIAAAQVEKAQLQQEVAELQATNDAWVKAGMLGKLERCNPGLRPCIRVNEAAGPFESQGHNDYRVIQGY